MRIFMTIVRVVIAAFAGVVTFVALPFRTDPNGTTIDPYMAVIDAIAALVLIGMIAWMWVDRKNLA